MAKAKRRTSKTRSKTRKNTCGCKPGCKPLAKRKTKVTKEKSGGPYGGKSAADIGMGNINLI